MKRNTDSRNLCPTWDLTAEELQTFYRGAGAATVVLDEHDTIIDCHYLHLGPVPDDEDEQQTYVKAVFPNAARQMDRMMSSTHFRLTASRSNGAAPGCATVDASATGRATPLV